MEYTETATILRVFWFGPFFLGMRLVSFLITMAALLVVSSMCLAIKRFLSK